MCVGAYVIPRRIGRHLKTGDARFDGNEKTNRWLICDVLKPMGLHFALPCNPWCALGKHNPDAEPWGLAQLTIDGLLHQQQNKDEADMEIS